MSSQNSIVSVEKVTLAATISSNLKALALKMASGMEKRSKSLIRSLCAYLQWISYVAHLLPRGYFHTNYEIGVNIVKVIEWTQICLQMNRQGVHKVSPLYM